MIKLRDVNYTEVRWSEIRSRVGQVNSKFAESIDRSNIDDKPYFLLVKYKYGDTLTTGQNFNLPLKNGDIVPTTEIEGYEALDLNYNYGTHPALIVLSKGLDCVVNLDDRVIPFILSRTGDVLGVSPVMIPEDDPNTIHTGFAIYTITAGARATCMLPKISQSHKHKRLRRKYPITCDAPKRYLDHFKAFKEIGKSTDWECEVLLMKHSLFKDMHKKGWLYLNMYLYQRAYDLLRFWSSIFPWDLTFSQIALKRDIKKLALSNNFVKHIFALASGKIVGLEPATDNSLLPLDIIQDAYINDYQIEHAPTIVQPTYLDGKPIYASLNFPLVEGTPNMTSLSSAVNYLDDVRFNFERNVSALLSEDIGLPWSPIRDVIKNVDVNFYHSYCGDYDKITSTSKLVEDERFLYPGFEFNGNLPFCNGLVQIKPKAKTDE